MSSDFHPNSQSTITSGDFHLETTWPPLLSGWKSPWVSIQGVWVIFAENLKVINADKCSPSLAVGTLASFCSVLMVDRFHRVVWSKITSSIKCFGILPRAHGAGQARNQLETPREQRVSWEGPKFFKLCPIILNHVQHIFPGGEKIFLWGGSSPLVTGLVQTLSGSDFFPLTEKASCILLPVSQSKPRAK